jgi:hypothetical protein
MATPLVAKASNSARRNKLSRIALSGNLSGTGTLTIAAPNTNTDRTLDLPDAGGTMVLDTATQTLTNKDIVATQLTGDVAAARITTALNASGSAPIYACRAWVNFNGTGTVAIRASGNVSSITDNGTGDYTVNFTTAMPDADYAVSALTSDSGVPNRAIALKTTTTPTTSLVRVQASSTSAPDSGADGAYISVSILR